ncbi:sugar phosphate isomerase/epimerase family protein [Sciscionella sediminilitoris]|uniref:sugar phosphate isomerase/epimerase family protein n=1 Tax=Sciscionella sediminilitoris TaxID=1445613 RepID=UPI0004DF89CB|nr:sugar phosphate isomerase/epimerase family protein [Sciscionella sp. SE31]
MSARISLNQATIRYADLATALHAARTVGIPAIGLWREPVAAVGIRTAAAWVAESGLRVSSLCRGGFFTDSSTTALADNRRAIEETATLAAAGAPGSAPVLVLVPGGLPNGDRDLAGARCRVRDMIAELVEDAAAAGVILAIEPMHPMYAADRGVVSTLAQALEVAEQFPPEVVGVVVDTFHIWWEPGLEAQIARAGRDGRIASYQVSDWVTPLPSDVLLARGMPGEGHIDLPAITRAVENAGYRGDVEVEIFNREFWETEPVSVAERTVKAVNATLGLGT